MSPYKLQTYIHTTCYIKTNWKTYLKTYVSVLFGFRSNHSCQTALINIKDKWIEEMNNVNVNVIILLDIKKAFGVVDHDIMAKKFEIYGFNKLEAQPTEPVSLTWQ